MSNWSFEKKVPCRGTQSTGRIYQFFMTGQKSHSQKVGLRRLPRTVLGMDAKLEHPLPSKEKSGDLSTDSVDIDFRRIILFSYVYINYIHNTPCPRKPLLLGFFVWVHKDTNPNSFSPVSASSLTLCIPDYNCSI